MTHDITSAVREVGRWPVLTRVDSFLAEAAVAELLHREDPHGVWWAGGRNVGWDVSSGDLKVDAKVAFIDNVNVRGVNELCLGFMGSPKRSDGDEAREGITYALVLLHHEGNDGPQTSAHEPIVRLDATVRFAAFRFSTDEINTLFSRPFLKDGIGRRRGGNLYLPLRTALEGDYLWKGSAQVLPDGQVAPASDDPPA
ncbi:hypothetical protein CHO01_31750 [Cellulomonas hominis]|uniref:Uncharacterized protein n=1 Tax=Cellulomonas hominis TaxID=156981 RepID=A0A511FFM6_9CELL|nr:hypothetical protein [Cellulomonas hominis]MBB5474835.1 hypothetical protein [Cellulomonas hominis]NKY05639.1 hypothetical protein [Cellulomonas hominis]GEL48059.1 hypothetical protein CHO01_31750 [Cellulomonas hominis]